jgi:hypothetical protein
MDYFVLTLPEASSLYLGLALQTLLRQSSLRHLPFLLVLGSTFLLFWRGAGRPPPLKEVAGYLITSLILCILFWSDPLPFGRSLTSPLAGTQIASFVASQDVDAEIKTAEETGDVPALMQNRAVETVGFRLLLKPITETPLALARAINTQIHRPFSIIQPMAWLLGLDLTADVTRALADWVEGCYRPSMLTDREFQEAITAEQLLPWGTSPLAQALATREVVPGAMTGKGYFRTNNGPLGVIFLQGSTPTPAVRCDVYLSAVELEVQRWLFETTSPAGTPLIQVFSEDLGLDPTQQGRFLVYREILKAMGNPAPATSLMGAYATLSAANAGIGAVGGLFSMRGPLLGALVGAGASTGMQFERAIQWMLWWVGIAAWLVFWAPFILGMLLLVLVGFFPFAFLWALIPGTQFRPLAIYFLALLWACSSPLWFAIIDLAARSAASLAPQADDAILRTLNWAPAQAYSVIVTVIGILLVPLIMGSLFFVSFRGVGSLWRGSL